MPTAKFVVEVSVREDMQSTSRAEAVANAVKYLAYADQTDLFGYHGKVENLTGRKTGKYKGSYKTIKIEFVAPVAQEADIRDFLDECDTLARVESAECLTNPNL